MKRQDVFGYDFMRGLTEKDINNSRFQVEKDDSFEISDNDSNNSLLRLIYAIDSRTKLPTGDLTYYVSDKANPEIKKFILDNLMMDTSGAANVSVPKGLSDDLAFEFARNNGESLEDYANRLNSNIEKAKWLNEQYKSSVQTTSSSVASE